jgi:hypothetical protein
MAKEVAGEAIDNDDLAREGRLEQTTPFAPKQVLPSRERERSRAKTTAAPAGKAPALDPERVDGVGLSGFACRQVGLQGAAVGEAPAIHLFDLGLMSCVKSRKAAAPAVGLGVVRVAALASRED